MCNDAENHPGGPEIITDNAGGDSTEDFEDTGHSQGAREDLEKYYIGDLKDSPQKPVDPTKVKDMTPPTTPNIGFIVAILVVIIASAVFYATQD